MALENVSDSTYVMNSQPSEKIAALNLGRAENSIPEKTAAPMESRKSQVSNEARAFEIPIYRHPKNMSQGAKPILR